jgi:hypothetical protein
VIDLVSIERVWFTGFDKVAAEIAGTDRKEAEESGIIVLPAAYMTQQKQFTLHSGLAFGERKRRPL